MTPPKDDSKLVKRAGCIAAIFATNDRPSPRTFETWKKRRMLPFVRMGRLHYYDVGAVRAALAMRFTVNTVKAVT
jgi:hypothetical protein